MHTCLFLIADIINGYIDTVVKTHSNSGVIALIIFFFLHDKEEDQMGKGVSLYITTQQTRQMACKT